MSQDIVRKEFAAGHPDFTIAVTTERLPENTWAVVSAVRHHSSYGEKTIDLPVPEQTFQSQADAEDFGARMAVEWLEKNAPRVA
jgi:hypothetical protein